MVSEERQAEDNFGCDICIFQYLTGTPLGLQQFCFFVVKLYFSGDDYSRKSFYRSKKYLQYLKLGAGTFRKLMGKIMSVIPPPQNKKSLILI